MSADFAHFTPSRLRRLLAMAARVDCRLLDDAAARLVPVWREVIVL